MQHPRTLNNATTWILSVYESDLKTHSKMICAVLRTFMNDYQETAWPSVSTIARLAGMSERSVQNHLGTLCDTGFLIRNGHSQLGTVRYGIGGVQELRGVQEVQDRGAGAAPELTKRTNTTTTTGRMTKPTLGEVTKYVTEKGYTFDPEHFFNYYESQGWRVGKNPMKSWTATCVTWQTKEKKDANNKGNARPNQNTRRLSAGDRVKAAIAKRDSGQPVVGSQ